MKVLPPPALHLQLHHLHPAKHHLVTWPQNSSGLHDVACVHFDFKQTMYAVCLINLVNTYGLPFAELELSQYKAHFTLQKHSLVMYLFCCMGEISHQAPQIQEALWKYTDII